MLTHRGREPERKRPMAKAAIGPGSDLMGAIHPGAMAPSASGGSRRSRKQVLHHARRSKDTADRNDVTLGIVALVGLYVLAESRLQPARAASPADVRVRNCSVGWRRKRSGEQRCAARPRLAQDDDATVSTSDSHAATCRRAGESAAHSGFDRRSRRPGRFRRARGRCLKEAPWPAPRAVGSGNREA